jgi:hypothetical protein
MGVFKSIEEFAQYVFEQFLTPPFYITEITTTGNKHPTNYALIKYEAIREASFIIPWHEVEARYWMVKNKLMSNSIDNVLTKGIKHLDKGWWDTNYLYYDGEDVITYISKKRFRGSEGKQRYDFWVLNMSLIRENPERLTIKKYKTGLWLNKYTNTLYGFTKGIDGKFFYKIPIKKTPGFNFMNWKESPLEEH